MLLTLKMLLFLKSCPGHLLGKLPEKQIQLIKKRRREKEKKIFLMIYNSGS